MSSINSTLPSPQAHPSMCMVHLIGQGQTYTLCIKLQLPMISSRSLGKVAVGPQCATNMVKSSQLVSHRKAKSRLVPKKLVYTAPSSKTITRGNFRLRLKRQKRGKRLKKMLKCAMMLSRKPKSKQIWKQSTSERGTKSAEKGVETGLSIIWM